jgi:Serine carboxypeptidase
MDLVMLTQMGRQLPSTRIGKFVIFLENIIDESWFIASAGIISVTVRYLILLLLQVLLSLCKVIYIDQPIGTGFSYGTDTVNSTQAAAPFIWKAFQILFESQLFSKYQAREQVFVLQVTTFFNGNYLGLFSQRRVSVDIMGPASSLISTNRMRRFGKVCFKAKRSTSAL